MVLLESMRATKPVIACDVPGSGMGWVVQHNETGFLVEPAAVDQLESAIVKMMEGPELRDAMGKAGRHRFLRLFTMDIVGKKIKLMFEELSTRHKTA